MDNFVNILLYFKKLSKDEKGIKNVGQIFLLLRITSPFCSRGAIVKRKGSYKWKTNIRFNFVRPFEINLEHRYKNE